MEMTFRWYGSKFDTVTLEQIRQIPGVTGVITTLYDIGFDGPIRPDHGRMIWGEKAMPGYGLYDRALGATYLNGLWEAIDKSHKRGI